MRLFMLSGVLAVPFAGPAAAQNARVSSTVSIQVLRAAEFAVEAVHDNTGSHHLSIRADVDDNTVASVVTDNGLVTTRMVTMMGRGYPFQLRLDKETPSTFVQIMY